jgi:hypothetical protein
VNSALHNPLQNMPTVFSIGDDNLPFTGDAMSRGEHHIARNNGARTGAMAVPVSGQHHHHMRLKAPFGSRLGTAQRLGGTRAGNGKAEPKSGGKKEQHRSRNFFNHGAELCTALS